MEEIFELEEMEQQIRDISGSLRKRINDLGMMMFLRTTVVFKNIGKFETEDG